MVAPAKQTSDDLVILNFVAENFKRIKTVSIKPDGSMVVLAGANKQGKSSILDAIWATVAGKGVIQKDPIRKGEEKAMIRLDLGPAGGPVEVIATRTFKRAKEDSDASYTTAITVESPEGARFPQPQAFMDKILGALALDPVEFMRMKTDDKVVVLQKLIPGVDFDEMDRKIDGEFNRRAETNRDIKTTNARLSAIKVDPDAPAEPVDVAAVVAELETVNAANAEIETRKMRRAEAAQNAVNFDAIVARKADTIADLEAQVDAHKQEMAEAKTKAADIRKQLADAPELPAPVDTLPLRDKIRNAAIVNEKVAARVQHDSLAAELKALEAKSEAHTAAIAQIETDKKTAIDKAGLPVDGIAFGKFGVTLNGFPFDQASDAEQWDTSIRVAAAMKPTLGVIRVRDGSLLDKATLAALATFAAERKMQVWIERVDESGKLGFIIEDGMVKSHAEPEAPAAADEQKTLV